MTAFAPDLVPILQFTNRMTQLLASFEEMQLPLREDALNVLKQMKGEGRLGCYICVGPATPLNSPSDFVPYLVSSTGFPIEDRREKYFKFSQEKPARTLTHAGHRLSRQSADDTRGHYTGGAVGVALAIGISGYPPDVDEMLAVCGLYRAGDLNRGEAETLLGSNLFVGYTGLDFVFRLASV